MVDTPTASTIYMGVYSGTSSTAPASTSSYKWFKTQGPKGTTGATGAKGAAGRGVKWTSMFGVPVTADSTTINGTIKPRDIETEGIYADRIATDEIYAEGIITDSISGTEYPSTGSYISLMAPIKVADSVVTITAAAFYEMSDKRLKENIKQLSSDGDISFVEFNYIADESKKLHYGVIAHEIEQVYPDLVKEDDDGIKSVNYIELLIMEIAKLRKRIKELERRKN